MYPTITNEELEAALAEQPQIVLDVRETADFDEAHIDGAVNIPINELAAKYELLDRTKPIYVICYLGGRSQIASDFLQTQGYQVTNVSGGMNNWQSETTSS